MFQATRSPAHTWEPPGKPVGVDCHDAPDFSSSRTNCPAAKPDALAIVTELAACAPSDVRVLARRVIRSGPATGPTMTTGWVS